MHTYSFICLLSYRWYLSSLDTHCFSLWKCWHLHSRHIMPMLKVLQCFKKFISPSFFITSPVYVIIALILVVFASFSPSFLSFAKISSGIVKNPSMYLDYRSSGQAKIWFKNFSMKDILLLKNNGWKLRVDFFPGTGGILILLTKKGMKISLCFSN